MVALESQAFFRFAKVTVDAASVFFGSCVCTGGRVCASLVYQIPYPFPVRYAVVCCE